MPCERPERVSQLDEASFGDFYRRTSRRLWAYAYRVTNDPADTDDIVQEAFCRLLRSGPVGRDEEQLRRYLFRVASNLAVDRGRVLARSATVGVPMDTLIPAAARSVDEQDVVRLFQELSARERALLWLAYVEEATHAEIASALGVGRLSVRVLLFRARRHLRDLLMGRSARRR